MKDSTKMIKEITENMLTRLKLNYRKTLRTNDFNTYNKLVNETTLKLSELSFYCETKTSKQYILNARKYCELTTLTYGNSYIYDDTNGLCYTIVDYSKVKSNYLTFNKTLYNCRFCVSKKICTADIYITPLGNKVAIVY